MNVIDLRSDTVTHPTPEMRDAMAKAVVGDDVFGDDPTVQQLEADAAQIFGKEAGLFVSSGTQGNLVALLTHCQRGEEIILGDRAHTFILEGGGMSALGGIIPHIIPVQHDGTLRLEDITGSIRGENEHFPRTKLITLENTHNATGGIPLSKEYTRSVSEIAREHNLKFHIDGARIFNAATAYNVSVAELTETADSVTFCLSKGLCAPAGSVLLGSKEFIKEARRARKILGGGMRQAGVLAAAGLIALHKMSKRLREDHANAQLLAEGLSEIPGITVTSHATNFVFFNLQENAKLAPEEFVRLLRDEYGIILIPFPGSARKFRCVLHYWITTERVKIVIDAMKTLLSQTR